MRWVLSWHMKNYLLISIVFQLFPVSTSDVQMIRANSPVPRGRLWWVVKYGPSRVHSHIQASDEKHICCAARKGERNSINSTRHGIQGRVNCSLDAIRRYNCTRIVRTEWLQNLLPIFYLTIPLSVTNTNHFPLQFPCLSFSMILKPLCAVDVFFFFFFLTLLFSQSHSEVQSSVWGIIDPIISFNFVIQYVNVTWDSSQ